MQEGKVIAYESRKLKEHEQKYSAYDLELTAVIHALKMWRHYLFGRRFLLLTDHHNLTNYFSQPTLNARQARWADFLSGFDFDIKHLKGKENRVADALSQKVQCLYEITFSRWENSLQEMMKTTASQDAEYQQLKQQMPLSIKGNPQDYEIKAEHQHPARLLQPLPIPEWKWEVISMDFITGLPKTKRNNDSIMVVVDKLSKVAHFIPVQSTYKAVQIAHVFMQNIFRLHGLPKTIISDRDVKFTSAFWRALFAELGTQLNFSTAYHPQTDGQTERVNQIVEDMLRACVMQKPAQWEDYLHLVEFAYNNGYHTSIQMSPFEVLYGRKCRTPTNWSSPEDKLRLGPEMLKEMEDMVKRVRTNLKAAQDRQKNFADRKRRFKEYQVEPEGEVRVEPLSILDRREVQLRKRVITQIKVQWQHYGPEEATWEDKELF
eukprot:PITA_10727